ncbi:MAG: electron transfer flavoprotein subunit beta/FixA family protein [Ignavibacteria bacterium]|nr:electron transfer flavoprotein subunit beta/FixA family protein [Ignavibacteria bacterium]
MNILVCISQVPDTTTKIQVSGDGQTIDKTGVKFILNPYDEFAIEEGLKLREQFGGTVTALTVGTETSKEILRTALAMGVDKACITKTDAQLDSYNVAENIAGFAKSISPDLIIFGRQSIDFDSSSMAPMVAEMLNMPSISVVSSWKIEGTGIQAERDIEGGKEILSTSLPCVISAQKGLNDPRYPKLPDIMKAKSKPIEEIAPCHGNNLVALSSMALPSSKRVGMIVGDSDADITSIVTALHEQAKVI